VPLPCRRPPFPGCVWYGNLVDRLWSNSNTKWLRLAFRLYRIVPEITGGKDAARARPRDGYSSLDVLALLLWIMPLPLWWSFAIVIVPGTLRCCRNGTIGIPSEIGRLASRGSVSFRRNGPCLSDNPADAYLSQLRARRSNCVLG
jgi:hypothetical protein